MVVDIAGGTFSANEAASITDVPLKEVHRIIDRGLLGSAVEVVDGGRVLQGIGLLALKMAHETRAVLTLAGRRRLVGFLLRQTEAKAARTSCVSVDLASMRDDVQSGLAQLRRARNEVVSDPAVLAGTPCIRGTRIPAHDIAEMLASGDSVESILKDFSWLSASQIELASVYARAYPRRGRPRREPLHQRKQVALSEAVFDDLPAAGS
ncbi:MAG: DUF433 domain-containing protein [Gammaproteobacteria bacterium]|nr:DUF433 domain-containing protein [Gammaproteobacteria bacterium]